MASLRTVIDELGRRSTGGEVKRLEAANDRLRTEMDDLRPELSSIRESLDSLKRTRGTAASPPLVECGMETEDVSAPVPAKKSRRRDYGSGLATSAGQRGRLPTWSQWWG